MKIIFKAFLFTILLLFNIILFTFFTQFISAEDTFLCFLGFAGLICQLFTNIVVVYSNIPNKK